MTEEFSLCFLCAVAPAASSEHILPEALGGNRTVEDFICESCNNRLGKAIDSPLIEQLRPFAIRQSAQNAVDIRNLTTAGGYNVTLKKDNTLQVRQTTPYTRVVSSDVNVPSLASITADSIEELAKLLLNAVVHNRIYEQPVNASTITTTHYDVGALQIDYRIGGFPAFRSVMKMGMAMLCKKYGRAWLDQQPLANARDFVVSGENTAPFKIFFPDYGSRCEARKSLDVAIGTHTIVVFNTWLTTECLFLAHGVIPYRVLLTKPALQIEGFAFTVNPTSGGQIKTDCAAFTLPTFLHRHWRQDEAMNGMSAAIEEFNAFFPPSAPPSERAPLDLPALFREVEDQAAKMNHSRATKEQLVEGVRRIIAVSEASTESKID